MSHQHLLLSNPDKPVVMIDGKRIATPEYRSWQMMKNRCLNPKSQDYRYYGGRGIKIFPAWESSFRRFFEDMGERPSMSHTLDRIDGNGDYTPTNCRWATRKTQSRNRDYCALVTIGDKAMHVWEWAEELGVKPETIHHYLWRVKRGLWTQSDLERRVMR